jgi:hydrogenase maturation factor
VSCSHDTTCITCGDTAVEMRVVAVEQDSGLARCAAADGATELVQIELVGPVDPGDELLVHAATAIATLDRPEAGHSSQNAGLEAPRSYPT